MSDKEEKGGEDGKSATASTEVTEEPKKKVAEEEEEKKQDFGPDYSYDASGTLVYTNPESKQQFVLNEAKTDWLPKGDAKDDAKENKYDFDGETYSYKDDATGKRFKWDLEKKEWKEDGAAKSEVSNS